MSSKTGSPRLGRGIASLMGDAIRPRPADPRDDGHPHAAVTGEANHEPASAAPNGRDGIRTLAIETLEPGPYQPRARIEDTALEELARSIRARGVLQPLLARPHPDTPGRWQIIAGERRWRAAQQAGLHELPVLVRALSDSDAMAAALVENLQRQDLNAVEEAEGYRRLVDEFGMTQERLAEAVGKSRSHVANTLRLLNLPRAVQAELRNGALTAGHARALLGHAEPEKAALAVISRGLSVRQTEALVADEAMRASHGSVAGTRREKDPDTASLERELSDRLGLRVEIRFDGKTGVVRIHYRTLDQLDGLVRMINQ
jgi:ParB family chromosome partitioning protein